MDKLKAELDELDTSLKAAKEAYENGAMSQHSFEVQAHYHKLDRSYLIVAAYDAGELTSVVPAA